MAGEGRGRWLVRGQGRKDAFCGFSGAAVGRGKEMEGVIWLEELAEAATSFMGLVPAIRGQLDSMIWNSLVDIAVF